MTAPRFRMAGTVLSTRDVDTLAAFYERLLGWEREAEELGWIVVREDGTKWPALSFHEDVEFVPPVWPSRPGEQQIMMHLDIVTDDLDGAIAHAIQCGAVMADEQLEEGIRVMFDPDGHPFCLIPYTWE